MEKKHVFLSYCRENQPEVAQLRERLLAAGESVWWDENILPGTNWRLEIQNAIEGACVVIVCLSKELQTRQSSGLYPEVQSAIEIYRQLDPDGIFLIPVRLSECDVPAIRIDATRWLKDIQFVDLFPQAFWEDGVQRLLKAIQHTRADKAEPGSDTGFELFDDLSKANSGELSGSLLAPLIRKACRRPGEITASADYSFARIKQLIDGEDDRLLKVNEGAGFTDWQQDYGTVASMLGIAIAGSCERSAAALQFVRRVADAVFAHYDFELVWDLQKESEFFSRAFQAARDATVLPEDVYEVLRSVEIRRIRSL